MFKCPLAEFIHPFLVLNRIRFVLGPHLLRKKIPLYGGGADQVRNYPILFSFSQTSPVTFASVHRNSEYKP